MTIYSLRFAELESGCFVPISHSLNTDGYFRKYINGKQQMFHRVIYELHNGPIPKGYEVDHMCRNRACCNVKHLRTLTRSEHLLHTNTTRYAKRHEAARLHWLDTNCTGTELALKFGVSFSAGCKWVRKWRTIHDTH